MNDEKVTLGFRDTFSLLRYGFSLVIKLAPSYLPLALILSLIRAAQPLVMLFFSARILNELAGNRDVQAITLYAGLTVGVSFILSVAAALIDREIELNAGWDKAFQRVQIMQAERYIRMDYAHAEDGNVFEILARMDTQAMGNGLGLMNMFFHPIRAMEGLFSLALAAVLLSGALSGGGSPPLSASWPSFIIYGMFALGIAGTLIYRSREKTVLERVFIENARANTAANFFRKYIESGQAAKDVRLYDQGSSINEIFSQSFSSKSWLKFFMWGGRQDGFNYGYLAAIGGGFYIVTGLGALGGAASVGDIVRNVGAIMALASAIGSLVSICGQIYNNAPFLKPMREFMTLPELLAKGTERVPRLGDRAYAFEFRDVSFRYPGAEDYALKNLNLKLNAGQRLAVVGLNGSGKTTMIKLLCRFYDPTEGEILLGGVNIREYDYDEYIKLFSVVFQDYMLFPLWLGNNVAAGAEYDAARAEACLKDAGLIDRLATMPEGLDTVIYKEFDENGIRISGGEAQKIALARALYKDAPVVVLDEPTAALDPIAERDVYTTFDKTIGDKTAVFISHRLSSCRFCDDIAVFEGGRLIQRGDHEALLKDTNGRYRELWNAQAQHYNDEA